ncbi:MAG: copper amine oxidase N-terminal domain-containing protein [Candidatus Eremiobacteraeota bacterium]|nr:copper amine oxidase N-terminal domain-containing protein [Candidatus Eremiobacteraeota bacterium]
MKKCVTGVFLVLVAISALMPWVWASDEIKVYINNRLITFDQPPAMIQGNILVPMRGVFEELGAEVKWKAATRTIYAKRDTTEIVIQIGAPFASVSGKTTELAAPAAMVKGRTMVPLRFVSEALGAEVKWLGATKTVMITHGGGSGPTAVQTPQPPAGEVPKITKVSHNATGSLKPGDVLVVTLEGDPGCAATADIYGVVQNSPLRESSPGKYQGSITIPANAGNLRSASVFGRLNRNGREAMSASVTGLQILSEAVKVSKVLPKPKEVISTNKPNILIVLESIGSARMVPSSAKLSVNRQDVTAAATISEELISYVPAQSLPEGVNTVALNGKDTLENAVRYRWEFQVKTQGSISSLTHNAAAPLMAGNILQVTLQGDPGGTADFDIGTFRKNIPMGEKSPGEYIGNYTVLSGDAFQNMPVTGRLTVPGKAPVTLNSTTNVSIYTGVTLKLISPQAESNVARQFTISGTTSPFARVQVSVKIVLASAADLQSDLVTTEVQANEGGYFQYILNDPLPIGGGSYLITAVATDSRNQQSERISIRVGRK